MTSLSFGILSTWPNHFSLWDVINLIIFFRLISSSISSLVLILHRPFTSLVGPEIFLSIFLSNIYGTVTSCISVPWENKPIIYTCG